jgi:IS1 family transposase
MANVLAPEMRLQVVHLLVEGNSFRSIERLTGVHRDTVMRLLVGVGNQCRAFLDRKMRNLNLTHLQCDEIWTFCKKKQGRLKPHEIGNERLGDQYLYVALDQETKLIPSFVVGKRNRAVTEMFMDDLASRLNLPELFEAGLRPQISTDGWQAYPNAVDGAFAGRCDFGTIIKNYAETEQPGRYGPPTMIGTERNVIQGDFEKRTICTSHVERDNLTIRTFMKRFTRLALGFSKKLENLAAAVALHFAHYNFCRRHGTLRMTPAMKAKIAGHPWTLEELLTAAGNA